MVLSSPIPTNLDAIVAASDITSGIVLLPEFIIMSWTSMASFSDSMGGAGVPTACDISCSIASINVWSVVVVMGASVGLVTLIKNFSVVLSSVLVVLSSTLSVVTRTSDNSELIS